MVREWSVCLGGEPLSIARTCKNIPMHWCVLVYKSEHTFGHKAKNRTGDEKIMLKQLIHLCIPLCQNIVMNRILYDPISSKL